MAWDEGRRSEWGLRWDRLLATFPRYTKRAQVVGLVIFELVAGGFGFDYVGEVASTFNFLQLKHFIPCSLGIWLSLSATPTLMGPNPLFFPIDLGPTNGHSARAHSRLGAQSNPDWPTSPTVSPSEPSSSSAQPEWPHRAFFLVDEHNRWASHRLCPCFPLMRLELCGAVVEDDIHHLA